MSRKMLIYRKTCRFWMRCYSTEKCPYPYKPPDLEQTINNYSRTIHPLVSKKEYETTLNYAKDFMRPCGLAVILTQKLNALINKKENWLLDMHLSDYLSKKDSLLKRRIGVVFPRLKFSAPEDWLCHASQWIHSLSYLFLQLENMPKPKSESFKNLFGEHLEPKFEGDELSNLSKYKLTSHHIIVTYNNYFYKMTVINEKKALLDKIQIYKFLEMMTRNCQLPGEQVGIFTSDDRIYWRQIYNQLLQDKINFHYLEAIKTALFVVALDSKPMTTDCWMYEGMCLSLHGGGPQYCLGNRWFDTTLQLIINSNGITGMNLTPMTNFASVPFLYNYMMDDIRERGMLSRTPPASDFTPLQRLDFNLSQMKADLEGAINRATDTCWEFNLESVINDKFPGEFLFEKKLNPDYFYTLLLHYAYFKLHKEIPAHFDFFSNYLYLGETRVFSPEATNFCKNMVGDLSTDQEKYEALYAACNAFERDRQLTFCGKSPDRHLRALYSLTRDQHLKHELFDDPVFKKSRTYKLASLKLETSRGIFCVSAPLSPDGYTCWYTITGKYVIITISSSARSKETNSKDFKDALCKSMDEIQKILRNAKTIKEK